MKKIYTIGIIMIGLFFVPVFSIVHAIAKEDFSTKLNKSPLFIARLEEPVTPTNNYPPTPQVNQDFSTSQPPRPVCLNIYHNLLRGSNDDIDDGEVTKLQNFLKNEVSYPEDLVIGVFGPITEKYVKIYQRNRGIVSFGTAETTGYGLVGPKTRKAIATECNNLVRSPKAHDSWFVGDRKEVIWTAYGIYDFDAVWITLVNVITLEEFPLASRTDNDGEEFIVVDDVPEGEYVVKVRITSSGMLPTVPTIIKSGVFTIEKLKSMPPTLSK